MTNTPKKPSPQEVKDFHENADTDGSDKAIHHTIGPGLDQAASGQHTHDGGSSVQLLKGYTLTGSRSGGAALVSVIGALVKLGADDTTSA